MRTKTHKGIGLEMLYWLAQETGLAPSAVHMWFNGEPHAIGMYYDPNEWSKKGLVNL